MSRYYQPLHPLAGQPFTRTAVGRLIIATVGVFFLQILVPTINSLFALTPRLVVERLHVWQLVSYMFLHGSFWHLFFNLVVLWFFGSMVESAWGARRFLRYYLVCGVGGALLSLLFEYDARVVGASGAIFGLYLAVAMLFPESRVYLYFVVPIKVKHFVIGLAVLQVASGIAGPSGIAYFAHLGGMLAGLAFFRGEIARRFRITAGPRRGRRSYSKKHAAAEPESTNIDSILDKISAKGYDNLTATEKRILENYSRHKQNDAE